VGAGPGDPGLLTVRGRTLLERATVVVYDALANPRLLKHAPSAKAIYVGKKAAAHSFTQDQINDLLVEQARLGHRVVRLKGGDPFVFGRGGEECEALARAGIPFEVVPGVTAAIAVPAYAGIPVTHRDLNSSFTFITGHEKEERYQDDAAKSRDRAKGSSDIDWKTVAKLPCLAFYMGVKSLPRICENLIAHGMDRHMPAATIRWGTRPSQRTVVGTVDDIAGRVEHAKLGPPALTIIGKVVLMRDTLNWFERRPLFGQTVVVTRTRDQASELSERLSELGADVIQAPTIELHPPTDPQRVVAALRDAQNKAYDWIVFTSGNAVTQVKRTLFAQNLDARALGDVNVAAVGEVTAKALEAELCIRPDLIPPQAVAESLADALEEHRQIAGKRFLLLRADIGRPILVERLKKGGASRVDDVAIYETRSATSLPEELLEAIDARRVNWVTFTSSSTARNLATLLGPEYHAKLAGARLASIGPVTTTTLKELGLEPAAVAQSPNIDGLVEVILASS
jgi:uroporphyrinogen III methyltransferase/synthase